MFVDRNKFKRTRMIIIFAKFMMDNTLLRVVVVLLTTNKQNGAYEKYMIPDMNDESHPLMYHQV